MAADVVNISASIVVAVAAAARLAIVRRGQEVRRVRDAVGDAVSSVEDGFIGF